MLAGLELDADAGWESQVDQHHVFGQPLQRNTRAVTIFRAKGSVLLMERGAITRSERGRALQKRTWPAAPRTETARPSGVILRPEWQNAESSGKWVGCAFIQP